MKILLPNFPHIIQIQSFLPVEDSWPFLMCHRYFIHFITSLNIGKDENHLFHETMSFMKNMLFTYPSYAVVFNTNVSWHLLISIIFHIQQLISTSYLFSEYVNLLCERRHQSFNNLHSINLSEIVISGINRSKRQFHLCQRANADVNIERIKILPL